MDPTSIGLLVAEGSALAAIAAAYSLGRPQSKDSTSTPTVPEPAAVPPPPAPVVQTVGNTPVSSVVQTVGNTPVRSVAQAVPTSTPITSAVQSEPTAVPATPTAVPATVPTTPITSAVQTEPTSVPATVPAPATAAPPTAAPPTAAPPVSRTLIPELEQAITTVFRRQSTFKPTIEPANLARRLFIGDSVEPRQFEFAFHSDKCDPGSVIQLNNEYSKTLCNFMFTSAERVDGNYKFKDLENTRSEFIKIVRTITAAPATPTVTTATRTAAPPTVTTATPTATTAPPALLDTVAPVEKQLVKEQEDACTSILSNNGFIKTEEYEHNEIWVSHYFRR